MAQELHNMAWIMIHSEIAKCEAVINDTQSKAHEITAANKRQSELLQELTRRKKERGW